MRSAHHRSSEFGPDWLYQRPSRGQVRANTRRSSIQGGTLVWTIMFLCIAGVVGMSGQAAVKSIDRSNQLLAQALHLH